MKIQYVALTMVVLPLIMLTQACTQYGTSGSSTSTDATAFPNGTYEVYRRSDSDINQFVKTQYYWRVSLISDIVTVSDACNPAQTTLLRGVHTGHSLDVSTGPNNAELGVNWQFADSIAADGRGIVTFTVDSAKSGKQPGAAVYQGRLVENSIDCTSHKATAKYVTTGAVQNRASDKLARPGTDYWKMLQIPDILWLQDSAGNQVVRLAPSDIYFSGAGKTQLKELGSVCRDVATDKVVACDVSSITQVQCEPEEFTETNIRSLGDNMVSTNDLPDIYPGSVIQGGKIVDNKIIGVGIPKADGEISIRNITLSGVSSLSAPVKPYSQITTDQAIQNIVYSGKLVSSSAQISYSFKDITSTDELTTELGASGTGATGISGGAKLNYHQKKNSNTVLMILTQAWFSAGIERPQYPAALFRDGRDFVDNLGEIEAGNPPLYVRSVSYGRRIFVLVQSTQSGDEIKAALAAAFSPVPNVVPAASVTPTHLVAAATPTYNPNGVAAVELKDPPLTGSGNIGGTMENTLAKSEIFVMVLGGSSEKAAQALTPAGDGKYSTALQSLVADNGKLSAENPAAIIGYKLEYLNDFEPAFVSTVLPKTVNNCRAIAKEKIVVKVVVNKIYPWLLNGDGARVYIATTKTELKRATDWRASGDQAGAALPYHRAVVSSKDVPYTYELRQSSIFKDENYLQIELEDQYGDLICWWQGLRAEVSYDLYVNDELKDRVSVNPKGGCYNETLMIRSYHLGTTPADFYTMPWQK